MREFLRLKKNGLLSIAALLLALWAATFSNWQAIPFTILSFIVILVLVSWMPYIFQYLEARRSVSFYPDWTKAPNRYYSDRTLESLERNPAQMKIIARSAFRWLCGEEKLFDSIDSNSQYLFREKRKRLQNLILRAVQNGSSISFLIQHPNTPVSTFTEQDNERLRRHTLASIISYLEISKELRCTDSHDKLSLSITKQEIDTSRVLLQRLDGVPLRLILDLGSRFQPAQSSKDRMAKPFLCFSEKGCRYNPDYVREFEEHFNSLAIQTNLHEEAKRGQNEVEVLLRRYDKHSTLRNDEPSSLAVIGARHFISDLGSEIGLQPPLCIQLLVTKNCTTRCAMCDHYNVPRVPGEPDMDKQEIFSTLQCIKALGTDSVVVSGGEPLYRADILDILHYAKEVGLNVGMLTNGIMRLEPDKLASVEGHAAKVIASSCKWVQLSIDSFNPKTYATIRKGGLLKTALASLRNIYEAGMQNMEVCFTIQHENVDELPSLCGNVKNLPGGIPLRLKLAHSSTPGRDFLTQYEKVIEGLEELQKRSPKNPRLNTKYLLDIMHEYFDAEGVNQGAPLQNRMGLYNNLRYVCQVLSLTCKIDSDGKVYPCCFLYDDNHGISPTRDHYCIGSLRPARGKIRPPSKGRNALSEIWSNHMGSRSFLTQHLPVQQKACSQCIRHFYQNDYLNKLFFIFEKFPVAAYKKAFEKSDCPIWM